MTARLKRHDCAARNLYAAADGTHPWRESFLELAKLFYL